MAWWPLVIVLLYLWGDGRRLSSAARQGGNGSQNGSGKDTAQESPKEQM